MDELPLSPPLPLPGGGLVSAAEEGGRLVLRVGEGRPIALTAERQGETLRVRLPHPQDQPACADDGELWAVAYWLFTRHPDCGTLAWTGLVDPAHGRCGGLLVKGGDGGWESHRAMFWQRAEPWLRGPASAGFPQGFVLTGGRRHPIRPPKPSGELYRRFAPGLRSWISFRALEIGRDLERFSRWQNNPRVARFWEEEGDLDRHRAYLETLAADPHALALIGSFDDEAFVYIEAYWAVEDRIAPFYAAGDFDRGAHMLVGEEAHRGPHKVAAWLPSLLHYLFLDEPRTQTVVAEPRADNARMIGYMQAHGFNREKTFDFPHKRAALMAATRERFFQGFQARDFQPQDFQAQDFQAQDFQAGRDPPCPAPVR